MRNLHRRLAALEKKMGIHEKPLPMIIIHIKHFGKPDDEFWPDDEEDIDNWITYRQHEAEQEGQKLPAIFYAKPEAEAAARRLQAENRGNKP